MISAPTIARFCFLGFAFVFVVRVGVLLMGGENDSGLALVNNLLFLGIFTPLIYDWSRSRNAHEDRALFLLELADLVRLAVPVNEALAKLAEIRGREYGHRFAEFSQAVHEVRQKVTTGSTLTNAFEQVPEIPRHWAAFTRYSENPEDLANLLQELAESERSHLRMPFLSILRLQLMVPAYLGVVIFLTTYVVPTFMMLFVGMNLELPLMTRLLITVTRLLNTLHVGGLLSLLCLVLLLALPFAKIRLALMRALYYIPGASALIKLDNQHRIFQVLGTGLKFGVPLDQTLRSTALVTYISDYRDSLQRMAAEGEPSLSAGLARFPGLYGETQRFLIAQGENLETLPDALLTAAEVSSVDLNRRSQRLASNMDTFVLAGIGALVGWAVLAVFLPLYQLMGAMGR